MATKSCEVCSTRFEAQRSSSKFCTPKCRSVAFQRRHANAEAGPAQEAEGPTLVAVRAQLVAAGRSGTYLGAAAIKLAERIDSSTAVMGFAALVKQLEATMGAALAGVKVADDPVDEVRALRDRKLAG